MLKGKINKTHTLMILIKPFFKSNQLDPSRFRFTSFNNQLRD